MSAEFLIAIVGLPLAAYCWALWLGFLPLPGSATLLRIRNGKVEAVKGALRSHARTHVEDILAQGGVRKGFIAIDRRNRITFSRNIPAAFHQKLRNVLLNQ